MKENLFYNADGSKQKVKMLSGTEYDYVEDELFTGFVKEYDSNYSFMALLPKKKSQAFLYEALSQINFKNIYMAKMDEDVEIKLPEFKFSYEADMLDFCQKQGIETIFTNDADFTPMSDEWLKIEMHNFSLWFTQAEFTPYGRTFGVGNTVMQALYKYLEGTPAMECGCPNVWDNGNGALMRILPLAYTDCDDETIATVSGLTHAHDISKTACRIYIKIARGLLRGHDLRESLKTIDIERIEFQRLPVLESCTRDQIESSGYVLDTLEAALWSLLHSSNYRDCILLAANLGGDADTTCAVAGGLAGIMYGVGGEDGIPEEWIAAIARKDWITKLCDEFEKECND